MTCTNDINNLILSEAIERLHHNYSGLMQGNGEQAESWFLNHDATHVIFGTPPFDIKGESLNDIWTIFGSTVTLREYAEFFKFTTLEKVFNPYGGIVNSFLAVIPLIPKGIHVFIRTRKMVKKWPWDVTEELLQQKVGDLRKE